jgi:hypothetical protein
MQRKFDSYLWEVLSAKFPPNTWRTAQNDKGWLVSCSKILDPCSNKPTYQQILSTAFSLALQNTSQSTLSSSTAEISNTSYISSNRTIPFYQRETLEKMTVAQPRNICIKENIKRGKTKAHLINNIFARSETVHQRYGEMEELKKQIRALSFENPGPPHQLYRAFFNLVDLADRKWYEVEDHHGNHSWKSKMILSILRFAVLNSWIYSTRIQFESWLDWRLTLPSLSLISIKNNKREK